MARICSYPKPPSLSAFSSRRRIECSSNNQKPNPIDESPILLKIAVNSVTQLLRFFSPPSRTILNEIDKGCGEVSVSSVDDILFIIKSDYEKAYFVTGDFTSAVYAEDCTFEDPTISFRGTKLYSRNLKLLVPFFEEPSITLKYIEKGRSSEKEFITASWNLRTYLKFPWRPLISIEGSTVYYLDEKLKIRKNILIVSSSQSS
ncbi:hypothetical protein Leryth_026662 [Lithospermum erythrorhizon]|nr:hypothetical protein Leryth_026662 [Lithospermum erythrorhizon]